jgi:hypothetical protein
LHDQSSKSFVCTINFANSFVFTITFFKCPFFEATMEKLKAMYPVCTLIKSDGTRCGSPALTGANFCFQHIGGKVPKPKPETHRINAPLNFIYPSGHEAIQHNLFLVVEALSEGKIDNATALTYNRLFRSAQLNLHRWQAAKSKLNQDEVEHQMMPCAPAFDDPSASSASSVVKNESDTPAELNAEARSPNDAPNELNAERRLPTPAPNELSSRPESAYADAVEEPVLSNAKEPAFSQSTTDAGAGRRFVVDHLTDG